jgi:hypothetical protein
MVSQDHKSKYNNMKFFFFKLGDTNWDAWATPLSFRLYCMSEQYFLFN